MKVTNLLKKDICGIREGKCYFIVNNVLLMQLSKDRAGKRLSKEYSPHVQSDGRNKRFIDHGMLYT